MNIEHWFSVPMWYDFIDIDWTKIRARCLELEASGKGVEKSNMGGWHSENLDIDKEPAFKPLKHAIESHLDRVCMDIDRRFKLRLSNIWIIVNRGMNHNSQHYHPGSAMSGVIYVSADENSGDICFIRGDLKEHYPIDTFDSELLTNEVTFRPEIGKIIVFPSWLNHYVKPSRSDEARISIAFNTDQVR